MLSQESTSNRITRSRYDYHLSEVIRQRAWVEIDLGALTHNIKQIKGLLSPKTGLMAVVKADAYGHGAIKVAQTALKAGASWLAIATLGEGIELREAGITAPILILGAINTPQEIEAIVHWQLQPTLCNPQQALIFSETLSELGENLSVHLKLDTGMSRLGTPWEQATEFVKLVQQLPHLNIASIYSHFATADDPDPTIMRLQHQRFETAIANLKTQGIQPPYLHLANSAATLTDPSLHYDLVRVGLAIYGLYPSPHLRSEVSLKSVLQVKTKITQIKTIPPGTGVSYGHKFISDNLMKIAVVGIGYADGVPRNLSNRMEVLIRGQRVRQIGAITMDQLMLDVTNIRHLQVGEVVTIIGKDGTEEITADDWANNLGTISWEILCGFKHRLPRVSVHSFKPNYNSSHLDPILTIDN
ncbi:alanine racemase [Aphanothece sacrum]|uniref:Alanine racemase n=1 Tax=Aphanothece sacrum FPU1 TaxID=1920663 RepID=A0A401IL75_APHSA|nr:alanine racemase [Aphanothece sacrum]GBF81997.1 alanine racemase [Aphanothece sacrum FPU1]GBF83627.1 alanine racemase [Aphanothece sacrum FPU3]